MHRPAGGHEEPPPLVLGQLDQERAVRGDGLEQLAQASQVVGGRRG
jgi:hypothetical protein